MKMSGMLMAAILGVGAAGVAAQADTQSAMAGHGWPNHFDTCFGSSFAMIVNNCTSQKLFIVPIQATPNSLYFAHARASGAVAYNKTSCQAMTIGPNNTGWVFTSVKHTNVGLTPETLALGALQVPAQGTAHFECWLAGWVSDLQGGGSGGRLINVELR